MQVLGLFTRHPGASPRNILKILRELHDAQFFLPIIFTMEHDQIYASSDTEHISIFPAFYSANRRTSIPQVLAQSFNEDQENYLVCIRELSIFLIDSSDLPSVYLLAKDIAARCTEIRWLNLWFEFRCEIVSFLFDLQ